MVRGWIPFGSSKSDVVSQGGGSEGGSEQKQEAAGSRSGSSDGPESPEAALAGSWWDVAVGMSPWRSKAGKSEVDSMSSTATLPAASPEKPAGSSDSSRSWWGWFIRKAERPEDRNETIASNKDRESVISGDAAGPNSGAQRRSWWQYLTGYVGGEDDAEAEKSQAVSDVSASSSSGGANGLNRPVEAIFIPADLPIEEIAM